MNESVTRFSQVQQWIARMSQPQELPAMGSVLAVDDQATQRHADTASHSTSAGQR